MKIQKMFEKNINRPISGVIKVGQDEIGSLKQELDEYIITRELRRHFGTFFDNYSKAIDQPTDEIGVWISGFFGSGKSHFLKILSYLLTNQRVAGRRAIDYFKDKIDDPVLYATIERCTNIPTESILFNIDVEGPLRKDKTAVLRIFAKMFYNHLGFYGEDLKIVRLERFVQKQGKVKIFQETFESINGTSWEEARSTYAFFEDDIVSVLQSVLDMSEVAARNWFKSDEDNDISIRLLVEEIKEYVDSKSNNFRLLFCVDEVGQYIGDDSDLMVNLQSIVEQLGTECLGKVWVMVTSQEAVDSVVRIIGDDFSKIKGRFKTSLSLSSASVDEVIKKRILEKSKDAEQLLRMVHDKEHAVLKNLFTFSDAVLDLKGYINSGEFAATYPFVPYQFTVLQNVFTEIRKHGSAGRHFSGAERSMLSGFQEVAQKVQDRDENALVPFFLFYDTVHTVLEGSIRRVIERCQNAAHNRDGIEECDVDVLKLLYLLRYIDDIKANIDNIAILMIDDIRATKIDLRRKVAESLVRLERQNYVARHGDTYMFLTDEEQDIATDIHNTTVDSAAIVKSIGQTIFGEIYPSKKYKYGKYDFAYDQYIDETLLGAASGGVRLRFLTEAGDFYKANDMELAAASQTNHETIVKLSSEIHYFEELEMAEKIKKYVKQRNVSQLPESIQDIIRKRQSQARNLEDNARKEIEKAIVGATFFISGERTEIKHGSAKQKLDEAMKQLIEDVYSKLHLINSYSESDADILAILNSKPEQRGVAGTGSHNEFALNEVSQWLEDRHIQHVPVSMGDVQRRYQAIPYGWREIDIAAVIARLIVAQKIEIRYGGAVTDKHDPSLVRYLRTRSETDKANVSRRVAPSEEDMREAITFLRDWLRKTDIPADEDRLAEFIKDTLFRRQALFEKLLNEYSHDRYPEKEIVLEAQTLMTDILSQKGNNVALIKRLLAKQDDLRDTSKNMIKIEEFFNTQRPIFDSARVLQRSLQDERSYFASDPVIDGKINELTQILGMQKPYERIKELSELMLDIRSAYAILISRKQEEVQGIIIQHRGDVHTLTGIGGKAAAEIKMADNYYSEYEGKVGTATSLTVLDAMITQLQNATNLTIRRIEAILDADPSMTIEDGSPKKKITRLRRSDLFPVKRLTTNDEIDDYLESIRKELHRALENSDEITIN